MKKLSPSKIVMVFVLLSGLWIAFSDIFLVRIVSDPLLIAKFSIAKGFLYIAITAAFLYSLIRQYAAQRNSSEMKLIENRTMIANILDTIPQSVFWKDRTSTYLGCNSVFARAAGLKNPEQIIGKTDFDLPWPREEAEAYRSDDREVTENNRPKFHIVEPLERADGTRLLIDTTKIPLADEAGHVYGVLGVFDDITERTSAEETLRRSEERYRSLFDNMLEGYAHCRMLFENDRPTDFLYLDVNSAFEKLTGLHNVIGKKVSEVIPGIQKADPGLFEIYGRVVKTGLPERFEVHVESLATWFAISVYRPQDEHFVAVFDVITERKRTEAALRESESRFRAVMENISLIGIILDAEGRILLCNDYLLSLTGWKREEVLNKNWFDIFLPQEIRREVKEAIFLESIKTGTDAPKGFPLPSHMAVRRSNADALQYAL